MADQFNTYLSDQAAPTASRTPSADRPSLQTEGAAFAGIANIFTGAAGLVDKALGDQVVKEVDKNIETAFQDSLGITSNDAISSSMDQLEKLKLAKAQGKDTGDRFYLSLVKTSKELKNKFPNRIGDIDKAMRERGLTDPRLNLIQNQMNREEKEREAQFKREQALLDNAYKDGWAVHTKPGDPTSPIDKEATIRVSQDMAISQQKTQETMRRLGITKDAKGEVSFTLRDEFVANLGDLKSNIWMRALTGIRPDLDKFNKLAATARPEQLGELKTMLMGIVQKKDNFLLQIKADSVNLNPAEAKLYEETANQMVQSITGGFGSVDNIKDLNTMKAIGVLYDWASNNAKSLNVTEMPFFWRLSTIDQNLSSAALNLSSAGGQRLAMGKIVSRELDKIMDFAPDSADPLAPSLEEPPAAGVEMSTHRLGEGTTWQQNFINRGVLVKEDDKATGYSWIQTQSPMYNAYLAKVNGAGEGLSANDKATLARQMLSNNYIANLRVAKKQYPDKAAKVGAYAFDVVMDDLINNVRELRASGGGNLQWGTDLKIAFDPTAGQFVLSQPHMVGKSPGYIASTDRSKDPAIQARLAKINSAMPLLMETKDFKENYAGLKGNDFFTTIGGMVMGDPSQLMAKPEGGSSQSTTPFVEKTSFVGEDMNAVVKKFENDQQEGRSPEGLWQPIDSLEGGTKTLGYGHKLTKEEASSGQVVIDGQPVKLADGLSDAQVEALLAQDMKIANSFVEKELPNLTPNQKEAVASLVFNVGAGEFKSSKAFKALKAGNTEEFAKQAFDPSKGYVRINGKVSNGLVNRRTQEKDMFFAENVQYQKESREDFPKPGRKPTKTDQQLDPLLREYMERHPEADIDMARVSMYPGRLTVAGAYAENGQPKDFAKFVSQGDKPWLAGQKDTILLSGTGGDRTLDVVVETLIHEGRHRSIAKGGSDLNIPAVKITTGSWMKDPTPSNSLVLKEEDFVRLFDYMYNAGSESARSKVEWWFKEERGLKDLDMDALYRNPEINDVLMYIQKQILERKAKEGKEFTNINFPPEEYFDKFKIGAGSIMGFGSTKKPSFTINIK